MNPISSCLKTCAGGRAVPALIVLVSIGTLATAYTAQYGFGLEPCILCLYQRIPFAVAGVLGLLALFAPRARALFAPGARALFAPGARALFAPGARAGLVGLAGVAFLAGAGLAVYHVGVEQHWWVSAAGCSAGADGQLTFAEMKQALTQKTRKACDEVDWTLFGVSMATYNVFYSFGLGVLTLLAARELRKTP